MSCQNSAEKFQFLVELALENGAAEAKFISADKVVVDPEALKNHGSETDSFVSKEIKERVAKFWRDWKIDKRKML